MGRLDLSRTQPASLTVTGPGSGCTGGVFSGLVVLTSRSGHASAGLRLRQR